MFSPHPMVSAHFPHENCDSDHFWGPRLSVSTFFWQKRTAVIQIGQTIYGLTKLHYQ